MVDCMVSVIVPVYNVEKYLRQCLESLMAQTWENMEIICVNDGSSDGSPEILHEYQVKDSRIQVIDKENGGYGAGVNLGLSRARGEYIGIVEPDDFIIPTMYATLMQMAIEKNKPDIVKAGYWDYFDDGETSSCKVQLGIKLANGTVFQLHEHPEVLRIHPSVWSCIYRRDFLEQHHIRMVEARGAGWVDNPFFYQTMCLAKTICWVNEPVYYYRQTNANSSSQLKDCAVPIDRINEICDFLDAYHVDDPRIRTELCKRAILYVSKIENNPNCTHQNRKAAKAMLRRLDSKRVEKLSANEKEIYRRNLSGGFVQAVKNELKKHTGAYHFSQKAYHGLKYLRSNGVGKTYRRVLQEFRPHQVPLHLPKKTTRRVMFLASDNNRTSGAFLSMVALVDLLRTKHDIDAFVILPNQGNGQALLEEKHIPFTYVYSRDWVISLRRKNDDKLKEEIDAKRKLNQKAIASLEKIIRRNHVDLVHINTTYSYVGAVAALNTGIPYVWHIREFLEEDQGNTLWDREKGNALIRQADKVIAISHSIYDKYHAFVPDDHLVCIYNGIDAEKFYKPQKKIFQNKVLRFIQVGGFELYKGQIEFAKACARLYASGYRDFEVWFVGTGKQDVRSQVEKILAEMAADDKVRYWGYRKNVNDYLAQTDISFTCSRSEAFGRTTVEAMLSGNLLIGANSAGTRELVQCGATGLLYEQGNVDSLYETMLTAIHNPEKAKEMADNGRRYMYEHMTAAMNAKNVAQLYDTVLSKKS